MNEQLQFHNSLEKSGRFHTASLNEAAWFEKELAVALDEIAAYQQLFFHKLLLPDQRYPPSLQLTMDDLMEHFSGHCPEIPSPPPVHQPPPEYAGAKTFRVDGSTLIPAPTLSTILTPLRRADTVKDSRPSPPVSQPQPPTTPSLLRRPSSRFTGDGTMDLDAYRELFRRQEILPVANVYGSLGNQSTNHDAYGADHDDDDHDEDEGDYIRHFHDNDSTVRSTPPAPRPQRNLLSDLEKINSELSIKHDLVSEAEIVKDHPIQNESGGCYIAREDIDRSDVDDDGETTDQMGYEDQILGESVEQLYDNDTKLLEQNRASDHASSYNGDPARGMDGTREAPTYAHVPAASQNLSGLDIFAQRLRELHQQDMARDELLIVSTSVPEPWLC